MKRQDRLIEDQKAIDDIINRCDVCRIGVYDGKEPYIIPMNFGYRQGTIFMHCAKRGRKMDIFADSPRVCVEFDIMHKVNGHDEVACRWSINYESVIAWGNVITIDDKAEKREAMNLVMEKYSGKGDWDFPDVAIKNTVLLKIKLEDASGKSCL